MRKEVNSRERQRERERETKQLSIGERDAAVWHWISYEHS
jgi:hypothetical protein